MTRYYRRRRHSDLWAVAAGALVLAGLTQTGTGTKYPEAAAASLAAPPHASSNEDLADKMAARWGWTGSQTVCLNDLWGYESAHTWSPTVTNPDGGAYGIPQAYPGSKMASAGPDWQTNAATQIRWGLGYVRATYGTPCAAWSFDQSHGGY